MSRETLCLEAVRRRAGEGPGSENASAVNLRDPANVSYRPSHCATTLHAEMATTPCSGFNIEGSAGPNRLCQTVSVARLKPSRSTQPETL